MAFINRVCDKVFVINLEKDKERLSQFDSYMKKNDIKYDRFNAVLGSKVMRDDRLSEYCNTFCTDGIKGCALSHRSIWELMVENNYKNVLVFEDDAVIPEDFDRQFQDIWNHLPKDYDIVYFGCILGCSDKSAVNYIFKKINGYSTDEINDYILTTKGSSGTHCYMVSLEGAKKFITKPINSHIDFQLLTWIKTYNYKAYTTNVNMVETSQDGSSISDTYPILLNSVLKNFTFNNNKKPSTLDWGLSENVIKLGFNINFLLILLMLSIIFIPNKYFIYIYLWLLIEFLVSFDFKNTLRFGVLLSIPITIKYLLNRSNGKK